MKSMARQLGPMGEMINNVIYQIMKAPVPTIPHNECPSPKISIVIPVFNGEKYIANIFKTLQFQTLEELEIIFVNDCSTDASLELMKKYQQFDKRIKIIENKKNKGILYNRIYGALQSKGEYITFIDVDDMYCNQYILAQAYEAVIKDKIELLQFDYFGGLYDGKNKIETLVLSTAINKERYNKIINQPEIRNNFYYIPMRDSLISGIVYDKLYSRKLIQKMVKVMGDECWNENLIYMEDFIIVLSATREAESFICISFAGVWHWYENPEGMTNKVFQMEGENLKYPKETNKKLGDYLYIWEKSFDMTDNDPGSEYLRLTMIDLLAKPDNRHIFARTEHLERILVLCKRLIEWKYISEKGKEFVKKFGKETIQFTVDPQKKKEYIIKYKIFRDEDDDIDDIFG